jgi:uncharacterized protein (TIGR03118 family)
MRNLLHVTFMLVFLAVTALNLSAMPADDPDFVQTNLVSNIAGLATVTDSELINPWGVSHSSTSPFWVSNQGTNTATLYTVTDKTNVSKVNINPPAGFVLIPTTSKGPQGPTGQVNNGNASSFLVKNGGDGASAHFIFANLNGTISAWDKGSTAFIQVTTSGAVYTGLAINGAQTRLYAANDAGGSIDVFDSSFAPVSLAAGAFVDPCLRTGLVPFNVQDIGGDVYVTYAPAGRAAQTNAPLGGGAVAIFDEDGNFIKELVSGSRLAAPWGITLAPASFGRFASDLLVGNFSYLHSEINAFDPTSGKLRGTIHIDVGRNLPGGLWTIEFGVGGSNGSPDTLYFADGINGETGGLVGAISPHREATGPELCRDSDRDDKSDDR